MMAERCRANKQGCYQHMWCPTLLPARHLRSHTDTHTHHTRTPEASPTLVHSPQADVVVELEEHKLGQAEVELEECEHDGKVDVRGQHLRGVW